MITTTRCLQVGFVTAFALLGWLAAVPALAWQQMEIVASASVDDIFLGESVDYQVEIRNLSNPSAPDLTAVKEMFDVAENGDQSRNQSSTIIINGKVTQRNDFGHLYFYRLTPRRAGDYVIPAPKTVNNGKEVIGNTVPLRVREVESQDTVLVEMKADRERVFPTQDFTVTLRILVEALPDEPKTNPLRPLRRRPPHLEVPWIDPPEGLTTSDNSQWLQPLLAQDGVGFTLNEVNASTGSFFSSTRSAVFDLSKGRMSRSAADGVSRDYFVYELERTFTAEKAGKYNLGPVVVKGTFVSGIVRNEYAPKRLVAVSPETIVTVRDVPAPRPPTYCGGIGRFSWRASATPTTLRVGDPLTLTLEAQRGIDSGSLELISAPDLSKIEAVVSRFELIDNQPTGRVEGNAKRFTYSLRPKQANISIPSLPIAVFDPNSEKFVEVSTEPIDLNVIEATQLAGSELVGSHANLVASELKPQSEGVFQNITNPSELVDQRIPWKTLAQIACGCWITSATMIMVTRIRRRRTSDPQRLRKQQARKLANGRLRDARLSLDAGRSQETLRLVRSAIQGLVADTRNRIGDGLTAADVTSAMAQASVPETTQSEVRQLLESIESAEYGAGRSIDLSALVARATSLVNALAPYLERGLR